MVKAKKKIPDKPRTAVNPDNGSRFKAGKCIIIRKSPDDNVWKNTDTMVYFTTKCGKTFYTLPTMSQNSKFQIYAGKASETAFAKALVRMSPDLAKTMQAGFPSVPMYGTYKMIK